MDKTKFDGKVPVKFTIERLYGRKCSQVSLQADDGRFYNFMIAPLVGEIIILYKDKILGQKSLDPFVENPARDFEVLDFFIRFYQSQSGNNFVRLNICRDSSHKLCVMLTDDKGNHFKMMPDVGLLVATQLEIELVIDQELFTEKNKSNKESSEDEFGLDLR